MNSLRSRYWVFLGLALVAVALATFHRLAETANPPKPTGIAVWPPAPDGVRPGEPRSLTVEMPQMVDGLAVIWQDGGKGRFEQAQPDWTAVTYTPRSSGEITITAEVSRGDMKLGRVETKLDVHGPPVAPVVVQERPNGETSSEGPAAPANHEPTSTAPRDRGPKIRILEWPKKDPIGYSDEPRDPIIGEVSGLAPDQYAKYRVVIYALTNTWWVQPYVGSEKTRIGDGKWNTRIRTGTEYAALLVRREYQPPSQTGMLPEVGGDVLDIDIKKGR